jgi:hypothetical protein
MRLFLNYVTTSDMKEPTTTTWIKSFSIMFLFSISFGNYIVAVLFITTLHGKNYYALETSRSIRIK